MNGILVPIRRHGVVVLETGEYLGAWKLQPDGSWTAVHRMWNADAR